MKRKATIVSVGYFFEDGDPQDPLGRKPALTEWTMRGGDYPGFDGTAQGEDDPIMGGWSLRELRRFAVTAGRYVGAYIDGCEGDPK